MSSCEALLHRWMPATSAFPDASLRRAKTCAGPATLFGTKRTKRPSGLSSSSEQARNGRYAVSNTAALSALTSFLVRFQLDLTDLGAKKLSGGNRYLFNVQDHFTKFFTSEALPNKDGRISHSVLALT